LNKWSNNPMKFFSIAALVIATTFIGFALANTTATPTPKTSFDFNYEIGGDEGTVPVQVFDDGERTYFQFRETLKLLPIIFKVGVDGQREQVPFERRSPYVIVNDISKRYYLSNGVGQSSIEYVGARAVNPPRPLTIEAAVAKVAEALQPSVAAPAKVAAASPAPVQTLPLASPTGEAKTVYRDIVFPKGANVIPRSMESDLDAVGSDLKKAVGVVVYARTDRGGTLALRDQRGAAIKRALVSRGVPDSAITVIADPEIREDAEGGGFVSSLFIKLPPTPARPAQVAMTPAPAPMPSYVAPAAVAQKPAQPDAASHPKVLAATEDLLRQGLVTPEMATQILMRLKDATPTEGYRIWEIRQSDRDLRSVLTTWVRQAGWSELVWNTPVCTAPDFTFAGTFEQALTKLSQTVGLTFSLYTGDRVLVVNESATGNRCKGTM
jgi:outer membrane protein OmpA-like peptidoglycan-associated protein